MYFCCLAILLVLTSKLLSAPSRQNYGGKKGWTGHDNDDTDNGDDDDDDDDNKTDGTWGSYGYGYGHGNHGYGGYNASNAHGDDDGDVEYYAGKKTIDYRGRRK